MAKYIKSHSNYVLKTKHQTINDGTIYERDITTIGGLDQFAKGEQPIYKSGNFIITVNGNAPIARETKNGEWYLNGESEEWTLGEIKDMNLVSTNDSNQLVLKKDYYKLKDFAYYGSCVELIRASIGDILNRFPGELYATNLPVYYEDNKHILGETSDSGVKRLGGDSLFLLDNPYDINLFEKHRYSDDPLKSFNELYENSNKKVCTECYDVVDSNGNPHKITNCTVNVENKNCFKVGEHIATITVSYEGGNILIEAYMGNYKTVHYLVRNSYLGYHIRPKREFYLEYMNSLDNFEKVLLRTDTEPKYSAKLEVIVENSYGYNSEVKTFTFPTSYGGYNLATNNQSLTSYIGSLSKYAEFMDERFCDNLWRSMTHEAIKNFDWTFTREYGDGEEEEYVAGGTRFQKFIRICGREFDEIKSYIDGIKGANMVSYGKDCTIPDYLLSDAVTAEGWDAKLINPFDNKLNRLYDVEINPYSKENNQGVGRYAWVCNCPTSTMEKREITDGKKFYLDECANKLRQVIYAYSNEKSYTFEEVNNYFLKILKLNSKYIFRRKGTIEGIESLMSLFGLKSKRWYDKYYDKNASRAVTVAPSWDYEIKEYTIKDVQPIEDKWDGNHGMNKIDWINSTKNIVYPTLDYQQGIYRSYQGLPVKAYHKEGDKYYSMNNLPLNEEGVTIDISGQPKYLYPYFGYNMMIDGNPYYQMNGGWLKKSHYFDNENKVVSDNPRFTETYRNIQVVEHLEDLLEIPISRLKDNIIVYVNDLNGNYAIIDGILYEINQDFNGRSYISLEVYDGSVSVGAQTFTEDLYLSSNNSDISKADNQRYILSNIEDGTELRAYFYIDEDKKEKVNIFDSYATIKEFCIYQDGIFSNLESDENVEYTHYFQLKNTDYKNEISALGWIQLDSNNSDYRYIDSIRDIVLGNNPHSGNFKYDNGYEYVSYFKQLFKYALETMQFDSQCYNTPQEFNREMKEAEEYGFDIPKESEDNECSYKVAEDVKVIWNNDIYKPSEGTMNTKRIEIVFNNTKSSNFVLKFMDNVLMGYMEQMLPSNIICEVKYCG